MSWKGNWVTIYDSPFGFLDVEVPRAPQKQDKVCLEAITVNCCFGKLEGTRGSRNYIHAYTHT